ncbi:hypothetical protein NU08_2673 [Flavobacterium anhuiense]|uniref:Uncharacterized protein n=1 Tax=Flavobacterium anhuiense TaxID=459526 RepID=A0A444VXN3_9FLAO|nr:hypothetical protein NU08_2673 [Flavobacterium anhuiense]
MATAWCGKPSFGVLIIVASWFRGIKKVLPAPNIKLSSA